jgi:hypothetical protein
MSRRYQVTIQGTGFSTVPDEDGDGIVGFFAIRRVRADTPTEAYWTAARALEKEEKFQWLIESSREHTGNLPRYRLQQEDIGYLPWWRWYLTKSPENYIFYSEAEKNVPAEV